MNYATNLTSFSVFGTNTATATIGPSDVGYLPTTFCSLILDSMNLESATDFSSFTSLTTLSLHNNGLSDLSSIVFPPSVV
ncbi:hypothetical protein ADUPG1_003043, partial [Aduncisulcus paluster]